VRILGCSKFDLVKKLILDLNADTTLQIVVAVANIVMAIVAGVSVGLSIKEIHKDRRRSYLEERLEEFYIPLINLFGGKGEKGDRDSIKIEEIIVSKRHLCGKKVTEVLPQHFEGFTCRPPTIIGCSDSKYFYFNSEEELKKWIEIANTIWEEYIDVLKEYYKVIGIKDCELPDEKPEWMFKASRL
jgi:hypothetical protein